MCVASGHERWCKPYRKQYDISLKDGLNYHMTQQFQCWVYTPKELKAGTGMHMQVCMTFMEALFTIAQRWEQVRCLEYMGGWTRGDIDMQGNPVQP